MITYLISNKVLSIHIFLNTVTAYLFLGLLDDITVPFCENYISNKQREILHYRFITKFIVWIIVVSICFNLDR